MNLVEELKTFFANFPKYASQPLEVNDEEEYLIAKKWTKRVKKLVRNQLFKYLLLAFVIAIVTGFATPINPFLKLVLCLFYTLVFCWCAVGTAVLKLYKKEIFNVKSMLAWGMAGYNIGKDIETTHITVNHEYGNTYSVKSYTEDKGCLFAIIALCIRYMLVAPYCLFKGLPLTFKKYTKTIENMKAYKSQLI